MIVRVHRLHPYNNVHSHLLSHGFNVSMFFPIYQNVESFLVGICIKWLFSEELIHLTKFYLWPRTITEDL